MDCSVESSYFQGPVPTGSLVSSSLDMEAGHTLMMQRRFFMISGSKALLSLKVTPLSPSASTESMKVSMGS